MSGTVGNNAGRGSGVIATAAAGDITKSTSEPATDTNPSGGVGTVWLRTTTGEMYCCTDATTDENVWTNVGAGTGNITPWAFTDGGKISIYTMGGNKTSSRSAKIEKIAIASDGDSTDVAVLTAVNHGWGGCSSETHGYSCGGSNGAWGSGPFNNRIEKFEFASDGDATDIANMTVTMMNRSGHSTETHGYNCGGQDGGAVASVDVIDRFSFASDGDSSNVGDLLQIRSLIGSSSGVDYGFCAGGESTPGDTNTIQRFQFASSADSTDVGNLTNSLQTPCGHTGGTSYGFTSGGNTNVIQRYAFASSGDASDWGDLTWTVHHGGGSESTDYGYVTGGYPLSNVIQKFAFESASDATDVGDLQESKGAIANAHN